MDWGVSGGACKGSAGLWLDGAVPTGTTPAPENLRGLASKQADRAALVPRELAGVSALRTSWSCPFCSRHTCAGPWCLTTAKKAPVSIARLVLRNRLSLSGVASPAGPPAILSFHRTQQSSQIVQYPATRLRSPERSRDAPVQLLVALGPTGHLLHFIPMPCHTLTSPRLNRRNSTLC